MTFELWSATLSEDEIVQAWPSQFASQIGPFSEERSNLSTAIGPFFRERSNLGRNADWTYLPRKVHLGQQWKAS